MTSLVRLNGPLRRLLAALAVSQLGDWLYNLALLAFVYERTHSVTWTAATTAARVLPAVALGAFGGVLADRYDRRRLMIASDVLRAAAMVLLAAVALAGLPVLLAPVLAAACTAAGVVYPPAVAATVPRLVRDADLPAATAARSAIQSVTIVAGPVAGGVLLLLGSPAMAFLFNALTFGASAVFVLGLRGAGLFTPAAGGPASGVLRELWSGVLALRDNGFAARLVGADIVCSVVYGAHTVLLLLLGQRLGYGDAGYGYLLAACGAGGLVGALLAPRLSAAGRPNRAVAAVLCVVVALPAGMLAVTPWLAGAVVLAAAVGAGSIMVEVTTDTALARSLDEAVLARAYGLAYPASIGGIVVGSLVASPLVALLGMTGALVAVGALAAGYAGYLCLPSAPRRTPRQVDAALVSR